MGTPRAFNDPQVRLLVNGVASLASTMGGYAFAWLAYRDYVPPLNKAIWGGFSIALFAYWIGVMLVAAVRMKPDAPAGWRRTRLALEFGTWLGVNGVTWLFMPYGDTALQHVTLLFSTSYCAATILATAGEPVYTKTRIAVVMGGLAAICVIERIELWPYLTAYLIILAAVLMTFDQLIHNLIANLRAARTEAEAARDARTRFLQAATHDLGQPLQASRLFHEQAMRAAGNADRQAASEAARNAFAAMERLLRAILDHLRLSEGRYPAKDDDVRADALLAAVVRQHSAAARLEGVDLAAFPAALSIRADAHLCERVLSNFVDNALRHGRARRVRLGARRQADGSARLFVADDGIGIDRAEIAELFEDYAQGREHGEGGFGLGLASARRAAAAMGGTVGHEARWRRGAQFFLELPARG